MMKAQSLQSKTMSSREIAEICKKVHKNVIRVIEHARDEHILTAQIEPLTYKHRGNDYKYYELSKKDSMYVVARLSPEFTMAIIDRWEELENDKLSIPQTFHEALRLAADLSEANVLMIEQAAKDAPKVEYMDKFVDSNGLFTFTKAAKIFGVNRKKFLDLLRQHSIIYKQSGDYLPFAMYEKHFEVKTGVTNDHSWCQTRLNADGMVWLNKRFKFGCDDEVKALPDIAIKPVVSVKVGSRGSAKIPAEAKL